MEQSEINKLFNLASELLHKAPSQPPSGPARLLHPPDYIQLELYGLYKQASDSISFPTTLQSDCDSVRRKRREAWSRYTSLTPHESRVRYLSTLFPIIYRWTNLTSQTLNWYLSPLKPLEKKNAELLLTEFRNLIYRINLIPEIMDQVDLTSCENFHEADEDSEFSFEDLSLPRSSRRSRGDSFSTGGFSDVNFSLPPAEASLPRRQSISFSATSIELFPTVPFTPNIVPTGRCSRRVSVASIPSISSYQPARTRNPSVTSLNLARRPSLNYGGQAPSILRDETSALLQSSSHRLGQGMTLVRQSLQRLEKLEERVNCAIDCKLSTPPPTPRVSYTSPSPKAKPENVSLTGWITQMCNTLLH